MTEDGTPLRYVTRGLHVQGHQSARVGWIQIPGSGFTITKDGGKPEVEVEENRLHSTRAGGGLKDVNCGDREGSIFNRLY